MNKRLFSRQPAQLWGTALLLLVTGSSLAQGQGVFDNDLTGESSDSLENLAEGAGTGEDQQLTPEQAAIGEKFEQAVQLMAQEQWSEALSIYNELAGTNDPSVVPTAMFGIGECNFHLKSYDQAIAALSRAMNIGGSNARYSNRAFLLRGQSYLETNKYREALDDFGAVVQNVPDDPEGHYFVGKAILRLIALQAGMDQGAEAQMTQGLSSLEKAIQLKPDYGLAYLERGRMLFRLRESDLAIVDLQKAVELLGADSDAAAEMGVALSRRGIEEAGQKNADTAKVIADLEAGLAAMENYLKDAEFGKKRMPWESVDPLHLDPETVKLTQAETKIALGDEQTSDAQRNAFYRQALADCDQLLTHELPGGSESRVHLTRGIALRMLNELQPAVDAFTRAIDRWPVQFGANTDAHLRRGICYFHLGEYGPALQDFQAASPNLTNPYEYEPRAMFWLGLTQTQQGQFEDAIRSYTRAISAAPTYAPPYLNRGLAYLKVGRYDEAFSDFNVMIRLEPNHPTAERYRQMAQSYRQNN